jgi:hypothetical protein
MQLESEVLLRWSPADEDDKCPKCGTTRAEFIERGLMKNKRILHAIIGQRGGKSTTLALIASYVEHIALCIANTEPGGLAKYFGTSASHVFHITTVASTQTLGKDTIWAMYRGNRENSPWFCKYIPWVESLQRLQDTPAGMRRWEYSESGTVIRHENVKLIIDCLNSNSSGLVGKKRLAAYVDELCRMEQTDSRKSAKEIYRAMDASCKDTRNAVDNYGLPSYFGMIGSISSPMSIDDFGMQLIETVNANPRGYAVKYATWDFNPDFTREWFAPDFKSDYVGTMRNFGAEPPGAFSPLVDRPQDFKAVAIDPNLKPTAEFLSYEFTDPMGRDMLAVRLERADMILRHEPRYIAADAGSNFDAFTVACAHPEYDPDGNIITVFDWVIRLLTRSRKQEVYFESLYQLLKELKDYINIQQVEFDHWNSKAVVQKIRHELRIHAEETATTNEHFIQFLRDGYSGKIRLLPELPEDASSPPPNKSAQGAAIYELLKLERNPKSDKIYNPHKGKRRGYNSDDAAHVICHAHRLVQDSCGYTKKAHDTSVKARSDRARLAMASYAAEGRGAIVRPSDSGSKSKGGGRGW